MKIKTKLNLGVGSLFLMILTLTLVSGYYIFSIKKDTESILKANYNTLEYSRNMLYALDKIAIDERNSITIFESNLVNQTSNITEIGEDKVTRNLKVNFAKLRTDIRNEPLKSLIRSDIFEIMKLNMYAIKKKSDIAKTTAETGNLWIASTGTFCFLLAFSLLFNLPNNIANPIKELTESIKQIANKNYSERVNFLNHNEFGDLAKSFNTMALKLQEYHNSNLYKLSFEKKRLETLINNMHDPILGLDTAGLILFANTEALKILGLTADQVLGKHATALALGHDLMKSLLSNKSGDGKTQPMKIFYNGKESYFEKEIVDITITPTGEEKSNSIGSVIILRNITIYKELDAAKTNFIATVSHELKTPIASIKLGLQLLENKETGTLNANQQQLVDSIKDDSERLLRITSELLELSQLETGNIQIAVSNHNPYKIIAYAFDAVTNEASQKHIEIVVNTEENLPDVKCDYEKTGWVLINFLTNAIRYSSEGSTVEVLLKRDENHIVFRVSDKGKGIEGRYKEKVFDKYFQVPGSHKTGTGLGLAISKEIIEAQNGSIGVDSELGLGSTFYFQLNIAENSQSQFV